VGVRARTAAGPDRIRAGLDRLIEEERTDSERDPERDAGFWSRKMTEVEVERRGYHRLAAKGHMTDEELVVALSELDEIGRLPSANWKRRGPGARRFSAWRTTGTPLWSPSRAWPVRPWRTSHPKSATGSTSCSGSASASDRTGPWRSRASLRRWEKKRRRVRRIANFRHLAYKGFVDARRAEEIGSVR
jgi:hypothetical protein